MSLTAFLKENVPDPAKEVGFVVSDRFKDEEGEPIEWKLKAMSPRRSLTLIDSSMQAKGKSTDFKSDVYSMNVVIQTVVYPPLKSAELQDSYGVMSEAGLLDAMLSAEEFNDLLLKCMDINGLNKSDEELKDEVKN